MKSKLIIGITAAALTYATLHFFVDKKECCYANKMCSEQASTSVKR